MSEALPFIIGAAVGIIAGWIARDFKFYFDEARRERNIMRTMQDREEKYQDWRYNAERESRK